MTIYSLEKYCKDHNLKIWRFYKRLLGRLNVLIGYLLYTPVSQYGRFSFCCFSVYCCSHCLWEFCVWSFFWYSVLCFLLVLQSSCWRRESWLFYLNCLPGWWCLATVSVLGLFLTVPWICQQCVIVVFPVHIHLSRIMLFPTMWYFDKCRLIWVCAASF